MGKPCESAGESINVVEEINTRALARTHTHTSFAREERQDV